jgi:DNA-binding LacI/PurR family transcriptional regulator
MSATIKDVAAVIGVSASTVSRAFSRPEKVDEETRRRVMAAAEHLGYRPNRAARALNTGRTGCIGAILPDLENPFFAGVLKGIEQAADELGYQTLVADTGESVAAERRAIEALSPQVDGLLLCSPRLEDDEIRRITEQRPVVLVNRSVGDLPHVSFDNRAGMQEAVGHLLALGHRRIGYAGGELLSRSARQRLSAFEEACEAAGSEVEGTVLGEFPPTFEGGGASADVALNAQVTALVVYNDIMAIGLMHRLLSYGLTLPGRLSVVGFDNVPIAAMVTPSLTTVDLPRIQAGRLAAEVLNAVLGGTTQGLAGVDSTHVVLPARLVVRRSTSVLGGIPDPVGPGASV